MQIELLRAYRTIKGRAVVVKQIEKGIFLVWHEYDGNQIRHRANGEAVSSEFRRNDIISEWIEPYTGEFWMNVYAELNNTSHTVQFSEMFISKKDADSKARQIDHLKRIDCVHVIWKEGTGLIYG